VSFCIRPLDSQLALTINTREDFRGSANTLSEAWIDKTEYIGLMLI